MEDKTHPYYGWTWNKLRKAKVPMYQWPKQAVDGYMALTNPTQRASGAPGRFVGGSGSGGGANSVSRNRYTK